MCTTPQARWRSCSARWANLTTRQRYTKFSRWTSFMSCSTPTGWIFSAHRSLSNERAAEPRVEALKHGFRIHVGFSELECDLALDRLELRGNPDLAQAALADLSPSFEPGQQIRVFRRRIC